jgi:hypothetical protein
MKAANKLKDSRGLVVGFWIFTALFCLEMIFTAYYELLVLPQAAQAFTRFGFPAAYFRVELSWAKPVCDYQSCRILAEVAGFVERN